MITDTAYLKVQVDRIDDRLRAVEAKLDRILELLERPAAIEPKPVDPDGWVEWDGGECGESPVSLEMIVEVRYRSGKDDGPRQAWDFFWGHPWRPDGDPDLDIVAYRIVKED